MNKYLILLILFCGAMAEVSAQPAAPLARGAVVTGGVGIESSAALRPHQREFNLKFIFTLQEGDYIADVAVKIVDSAGRIIVEQVVDGPLMLARLPAGRYVATLTYEGAVQTRPFVLGAKGLQTLHLRWKRSAADGPPLL